ncbi:hypothetical protein ABZ776_21645 [Streptomyces sp. NPDC007076]|uniref:hypothetical protein n=1 Tax=unclassified Streptomyces TaxID=2593676 RepID=UPI002E77ABA2|nr:hypothetical protein [Streptomyces sp. JV190]MEE1845829.1 hypothetical protein [Streptomyces sp. JV190]
MPNRLLRTAVLAAVAAGAVLVPSAAAFADASPSTPSVERSAAAGTNGGAGATPEAAQPSAVPRGGVAAGDSPAPAVKRPGSAAPRGGVAAGERPAGTSGDSTTMIAGSAAGALLLAGAGTVVLRRRSAAQRNG